MGNYSKKVTSDTSITPSICSSAHFFIDIQSPFIFADAISDADLLAIAAVG
jgi:hypothetical protein